MDCIKREDVIKQEVKFLMGQIKSAQWRIQENLWRLKEISKEYNVEVSLSVLV